MDWSATGLRHRWWVDLLDLSGNTTGLLDGVTAMSVSHKAGAAVRGSATLDVVLRSDVDLLGVMARIWVEVTDPSGDTYTGPLLTGLCEVDGSAEDDLASRVTVQVQDVTCRLDPKIGTPVSVPAGTLVTGKIRELLATIGVTDPAITDSSAVTRTAAYFKPDETWRHVINALGDVAGYAAAWADEWGRMQLHPYMLPRDRPIAAQWVYGATSTMLPAFSTERDVSAIPNHLVRVAKSDADVPALTSELWDTDPASRWSTVSRGRVIADVEIDVDVATQTELDKRAARDWAIARQSVRKFTIGKRWQPARLGDRIRITTGPRRLGEVTVPGWDTTVTLQGWEIKAKAGAPLDLAQATLEEVSE